MGQHMSVQNTRNPDLKHKYPKVLAFVWKRCIDFKMVVDQSC